VALLGGDLRGRLGLAQGAVVAELREQLAARDAAISESGARVAALQSDLERLAASLQARLPAEQRERERLGAEAGQARLLCAARGRQAAQLQARVDELEAAMARAQGALVD
jgi:chromosome segregation ATPase